LTMKIVTIHQPQHWPWLGLIHKFALADHVVLFDSVQYQHKYFHNRSQIWSDNGPIWLNVPVKTKGAHLQKINEVIIDNSTAWRRKCMASITFNYRKAPFYNLYFNDLQEIYAINWEKLVDLNIAIIRFALRALGLNPIIECSSEMGITGGSVDDILSICVQTQCNRYISGPMGLAGKGREGEDKFVARNIEVIYQEFHHPVYKQMGDREFIQGLAVVDLLMNYGPESLGIIYSANYSTVK
jgi:hypothetical protein